MAVRVNQAPLIRKEGNIVQYNGRKQKLQIKVEKKQERKAAAKRREVRLQAAYLEQLALVKGMPKMVLRKPHDEQLSLM